MSKIRITESELRRIIKESLEKLINEEGAANNYVSSFDWRNGEQDKNYVERPPEQPTSPATKQPVSSKGKMGPNGDYLSKISRDADKQNQAASIALAKWNSLGLRGQIQKVQEAVGIPPTECDGKVGPQTIGKIFVALGNGRIVGGIDTAALKHAQFTFNKEGKYKNIPV